MEQEKDPLLDVEKGAEPAPSVAPLGPTVYSRSFVCGTIFSAVSTIAAGAMIYAEKGGDGLANFLSSYLMEMSLSMDNMFAFYLIFKYYKCPESCQSTALFWGMAGAILLRAIILLMGTAMILAAKPLMLIFAALLMYSSYGMLGAGADDDDEEDLNDNKVVKFLRWLQLPVTPDYRGTDFVVRENGAFRATPLFLVVATLELSDIVFAVDSVPAVLGLSTDTLVAYVAVMCAVLSLRTIYTLAVIIIKSFRYLQHAVALLLAFVGVKIILDIVFGFVITTRTSLMVIVFTLSMGMVVSIAYKPARDDRAS